MKSENSSSSTRLLFVFLVFCSFFLATACRRGASTTKSDSLEDCVRRYIFLCVALGERDPDSLDFYYGPSSWVATAHAQPPKLADIGASALRLRDDVQRLSPSGDDERRRQAFLSRQLQAIRTRADLLSGRKLTFNEENKAFFDLESVERVESPQERQIRAELASLLGGADDLAGRYEKFDAKFLVSPERVPAVMNKAFQACELATTAHLALPPAQHFSVEYVHDRPWSGFSYYLGRYTSKIEINLDLRLTVDRALQLACHEAYPGHHTLTTLQDAELVQKKHWFEMTVQPTFSPQSLVSEGLATYAVEMAFSDAERERIERDQLFPLAGLRPNDAQKYIKVERLVDRLHPAELAVASDYLDGKLEFVRAGSALQDRALMTHTEATLKYLNEYRSYVVTYTKGRDMVESYLRSHEGQRDSAHERWRSFRSLILNPDPLWQ